MRKTFLFFILVIIFEGCKKDKELLTGDVIGKITVYNQDLTTSTDNSGVQVILYNYETLLDTKLTDPRGQYRFENIPYGKYRIDLQKENYILPPADYFFYHIGGFSPTLKDGSIFQIPVYDLTVDSVKLNITFYKEYGLKLYLKIDAKTIPPFYSYLLVGFCGTSPEVSKDNYSFMIYGSVKQYPWYQPYDAYGEMDGNVYLLNTPETYYLRFYLMCQAYNFYMPINQKALGKPSNVISFKWQ